MSRLTRGLSIFFCWALFVFSLATGSFFSPCAAARAAEKGPRNVIFMIVDGCSSEQYALARWMKGGRLSFDGICTGSVITFVSDSVIADSAPAATAFATGHRTSDKHIGVGPAAKTLETVASPAEEMQYRPLATLLEGAKLQGKKVGIVATSRVSHATPAGFYAHVPNRDMEDDIMEQAVYQGLDIVFGGGMRHLIPREAGGKRSDGEDLREVLKAKGYSIISGRKELLETSKGKVFGLFAQSHMEAEIDRPHFSPDEPTLEEMTRQAIELLKNSPRGFFLMVEASQVDWACHANDPCHLLSDLLMYDKAVKVALDFAQKDGETLVIAVSDHNTGGMSIGNMSTNKTYSTLKLGALAEPVKSATLLGPLAKMNLTSYGIWRKMGREANPEKLMALVRTHWGIEMEMGLAQEILKTSEMYPRYEHWALGEFLCPRFTAIGWTTHGHTGGDVPLFAYGPRRPSGTVEAYELGQSIGRAMDLDLQSITKRIFVESSGALPGANISLNKQNENLTLVIDYAGRKAELPINKNLLLLEGRSIELEGVVVHAPHTGKTYIPQQAVEIISKQQASKR